MLDKKCPSEGCYVLDELKLIEAVAPDILAVLQERFKILQNMDHIFFTRSIIRSLSTQTFPKNAVYDRQPILIIPERTLPQG